MAVSVHMWGWFLVVLVTPLLDMQSPNGKAEVARAWEKGSPSPKKAGLEPCLLLSAPQPLHWKIGGPGYNPEDSWVECMLCLLVCAPVLVVHVQLSKCEHYLGAPSAPSQPEGFPRSF